MTDVFDKPTRSAMMAKVRGGDTKPEIQVRKALFAAGFRFRLHAKALPGKPDIVLARHRYAVFVHGCFWHSHSCRKGRRPASNETFWHAKLDANAVRDKLAIEALRSAGWRVWVVWECRLKQSTQLLIRRLAQRRLHQPTISRSMAPDR